MTLVPVAESYKDRGALGLNAEFSDPLAMNQLSLTFTASPQGSLESDEEFHFQAKYQRPHWDLHYRYNPASFYDFFGPTKTSRRVSNLGLGYNQYVLRDEPRTIKLDAGLDYCIDLERLPNEQKSAATAQKASH